jgi:phosphoribosylanthranilate isomerase
MNISTQIKLGGVNNLSDARFAAAVGVSYIGFCFDPDSPTYIPPIKAKEIMDWITGSHLVAEFGNQSLEEINDICELLKVDVIEVENRLHLEVNAYKDAVDGFHVYSSNNRSYDDLLPIIQLEAKLIWGLPISQSTTLNIIHQYKPFAINLVGGDEEKPGIKDFDELNEIIEIVLPQF